MRIAVLSDIHANLEALDAVLARADEESAQHVFVLGDIVGYGAAPDEVVKRIGDIARATLIAGNHDLAATGRFDASWFNSVAEAAIRWTAKEMDPSLLAELGKLEPRSDLRGAVLVHGSVVDPAAEYVFNVQAAARSFEAEEFDLCFFGHTHMPTLFWTTDGAVDGRALGEGVTIEIEAQQRAMLNPGSVGQPRDGDPRASFMIFDTRAREATVHRVPYDIAAAQQRILDAGLPQVLADRLAVGR